MFYNLQIAFSLLQQLHFAYAVFMTFCGCKGMKIGSNSEDNAFPDYFFFFVNLFPHSFSFQYDKHVFYCRIKIAWVAGFAF